MIVDLNILAVQIVGLLVIPLAIACIVRTVVYEEIFREIHEWCVEKSKTCSWVVQRKFFYLFTCEYCFSHWVTAAFLVLTRYKLLYDDWRGYLLAFFSLVFVANRYLNQYAKNRVEITNEKKDVELKEKALDK